MKSKLAALATMALMLGGLGEVDVFRYGRKDKDIDYKPENPPIPNGCQRHYFNKYGECPKGQHLVYFDAMKKKSAIIKWERWLNTQGAV